MYSRGVPTRLGDKIQVALGCINGIGTMLLLVSNGILGQIMCLCAMLMLVAQEEAGGVCNKFIVDLKRGCFH